MLAEDWPMCSYWFSFLVAACLAAPVPCQAPPATIEVSLRFDAPGTKVVRDPGRADPANGLPEPFRLVGRVLHWESGRRPFHEPGLLRRELARQAEASGTGDGTAIRTRVLVGRDMCWADVALTLALVRDAGLGEAPSVELEPAPARAEPASGTDAVPLPWQMVRVGPAEVPEDLVVPGVAAAAVRDKPAWQPEVDILQGGEVRCAGKVVYDPGRHGADRGGVVTLLQQLRLEARRHGQVMHDLVDGKVQEVPTVPILLRVDKWTGYRHLQAFLRDCTRSRAGFPKAQLAVTEQDGEQKAGTGR